MRPETFVYFVRPIGMDGPIKIGFSEEPAARLKALGVWSPYPLELIGCVPGGVRDEHFLHQKFSDIHSHREWFHSSPQLREVIRLVLEAGSMAPARELFSKKEAEIAERSVRKSNRIVRSPEHQRFLDLQRAVRSASSKLRRESEERPFHEPPDIVKIIKSWNTQAYRGEGFKPTEAELARVQEFLNDPALHAVFPPWWEESLARRRDYQGRTAVPHIVQEDAA